MECSVLYVHIPFSLHSHLHTKIFQTSSSGFSSMKRIASPSLSLSLAYCNRLTSSSLNTSCRVWNFEIHLHNLFWSLSSPSFVYASGWEFQISSQYLSVMLLQQYQQYTTNQPPNARTGCCTAQVIWNYLCAIIMKWLYFFPRWRQISGTL